QVVDRLVPDRAEVAVDASDGELDLVAQHLVGLDALPARTRDLHEGDVFDGEPAVFEEFAERLEPVPDSLRVVEAVDAEDDDARVAELLADLRGARLHRLRPRELFERAGIDRDGERPRDDLARGSVADPRDVDVRTAGRETEKAAHGAREV